LSIVAAVLAKAVASLAAKVRVSLWAEVVAHADVRVLIIGLSIAITNGHELSIDATIVRRVEARLSAWLKDNAVADWAEEVVVGRVAGVVLRVIWLGTAVLKLALD
jgi:hypothetical protein